MMNLKVGKTKCKIPNDWSELNISQYAKIVHILQQHEVIDISDIDEDHEKQRQKLINIKANRDVFEFLTGLDQQTILQCNLDQMNTCLEMMATFLNTKVDERIKEKDVAHSFTWKNKEYFFPMENMTETTFGSYIESEQILMNAKEIEGGRFGLIAKQMAILCKEKNEETTDELIEKKTRIFEKLPMNIAWSFVFFLMKRTNSFRKNIQTSSKMVIDPTIDTQMKTGI